MKSKTSFFNKTIFFKNLRRFWILPAAYLFCYIWAMPVTMYFGYQSGFGYNDRIDRLNSLREAVFSGYLMVSLVFAVGAGLLTALWVFSYLQRPASVNFFHSLPSDRKEMFFTNLLSGFAMMAVPAAITCLISMLVSISIEINVIPELLAWLLITLIMAAFFYLFAVICTLISGQNWFAGGIYAIFLVYFLGMMALCVAIISMINIGCDVDYWIPEGILGIISPLTFFGADILAMDKQTMSKSLGRILSEFAPEMIEGTIFVVIFVVAAYYLYKYRHSESAGDTVAFRFARPIFRWGFAISFSLLFTVIMLATVMAGYKEARIIMFFFLIIFGILGFIIAQMLIKKSVHIFKLAKNQPHKGPGLTTELVSFCVLMIIVGIIVSVSAVKVNKYVPDPDKVRSVSINSNYGSWAKMNDDRKIISEVTAIHQDIIDQLDMVDNSGNSVKYSVTSPEDYCYFNISYTLADGKTVNRHYNIPATMKAYRHIEDMYHDKDLAIKLIFGNVENINIGTAYLLEDFYNEEAVACYHKDAVALYEALLADVKDGNITVDDLYVSGYFYPIDKKLGNVDYNDDDIPVANTRFDQEIPFEYLDIDFNLPDYSYVIAFSPNNSLGREYYCLILNKNCKHVLDVMKMCTWFM